MKIKSILSPKLQKQVKYKMKNLLTILPLSDHKPVWAEFSFPKNLKYAIKGIKPCPLH